jgi:hypothetical protein
VRAWKMPVGGGEEELVVPVVAGRIFGVANAGLSFIKSAGKQPSIRLPALATGKARIITPIPTLGCFMIRLPTARSLNCILRACPEITYPSEAGKVGRPSMAARRLQPPHSGPEGPARLGRAAPQAAAMPCRVWQCGTVISEQPLSVPLKEAHSPQRLPDEAPALLNP